MRAIQITQLRGPSEALRLVDLPEPEPVNPYTERPGVVIDVEAAGVSFPEVLQSWGRYQLQPELPFVPGSEVAGVVRAAPDGGELAVGDRVAAYCILGGFAEVAVAPPHMTFRLPEPLEFAQGAGLVVNYHTAWYSLVRRGRLVAGEWVLVHGAAGGLGSAALQIAGGLGAHTVAVVSDERKEAIARAAGAEHVVRADGAWKDEAVEVSGGGVDIVVDPVGGDRFLDSLRSLREGGRLVVVGFTGGSIPEVKVNRLLLKNLEVVGAGWGAFAMSRPEATQAAAEALEELIAQDCVAPIVGERFRFDDAGRALELIESRGATGKIVLDVRNGD